MPRTLAALLLTLAIAVRAPHAQGQPKAGDFAVIVHPATPADDLSLAQLRRVFLGQQQFWPGGGRVVLFVEPPGTAEGQIVLARLYQMSESEFKRYWIAKTFRDDIATGPKIVSSPGLAKRLTATVPGAIAVIPIADVDSTVKVLRIDRRLPGATDYPLSSRS
jgi:hypothetical protein